MIRVDINGCINNYTVMKTLGTLLSSATRTDILRALMYQPAPAGLRPLARIAGALPRSATLAINALVEEGLVKRTNHASGPSYAFNRMHPDAGVLIAVFTAAARAVTGSRCRTLAPRASGMLLFIREAGRMLTRAKGSRHVA